MISRDDVIGQGVQDHTVIRNERMKDIHLTAKSVDQDPSIQTQSSALLLYSSTRSDISLLLPEIDTPPTPLLFFSLI